MPTFNEENEEREVAKLHHKEEEETVKLLAERFGMTYADLSIIPVNVDALAIVREEEAREAELAVIQKIGKKLDIAIHNPENQAAQAVLQHLAADRYAYDLVFVSKTSLKKAWEFYAVVRRRAGAITGEVDVSADRIAAFRAAVNIGAENIDVRRILGKNIQEKRVAVANGNGMIRVDGLNHLGHFVNKLIIGIVLLVGIAGHAIVIFVSQEPHQNIRLVFKFLYHFLD